MCGKDKTTLRSKLYVAEPIPCMILNQTPFYISNHCTLKRKHGLRRRALHSEQSKRKKKARDGGRNQLIAEKGQRASTQSNCARDSRDGAEAKRSRRQRASGRGDAKKESWVHTLDFCKHIESRSMSIYHIPAAPPATTFSQSIAITPPPPPQLPLSPPPIPLELLPPLLLMGITHQSVVVLQVGTTETTAVHPLWKP
jgi:hypothetical protein